MTGCERRNSALLRRLGQRFAALLGHRDHAFQSLPPGLRSRGYFFDMGESLGTVGLLAKFLKERIDFAQNKEHFSAAARLQEEVFVERAVPHEGSSHIPIAADLP